jgi:hypothetical protein
MKNKTHNNISSDEKAGIIGCTLFAGVGLLVYPYTSIWVPIVLSGVCFVEYLLTFLYLLIIKRVRKRIFYTTFGTLARVHYWLSDIIRI